MNFASSWGDALSGFGGVVQHGFGAVLDVASFGTALGDKPVDEYHKMMSDLGKTFHGLHGGTGWLGDAAAWTMKKDYELYSDYVSRPISTAVTVASLMTSDRWKSQTGENEFTALFHGDTWDKAWDIAKHRSPGQALILTGTHDILDPNEVQDWQRQWWFTLLSGGADATTSLALDPLGKLGKVVGATRVTKATSLARGRNLENTLSQIGAHEAATAAGGPLPNTPIVHALDRMQSIADNAPDVGTAAKRIEKLPMLRKSRQSGLIAHMMADSNRGEKNLIARIILGDGKAYNDLNATRPDLANQLAQLYTARANLSAFQTAANRVANPVQFATNRANIAQFDAEIAAREARESWIDDLIGPSGTEKPGLLGAAHEAPKTGVFPVKPLTPLGPQLPNLMGNGPSLPATAYSNVVDKAVIPLANKAIGTATDATARMANLYEKAGQKGAQARSAIAQQSQRVIPQSIHYYNPFNAAVRVIGKADNFFNRQAPRGYLDTNDPEGWRELDNMLATVKGFDPSRRQTLVGEYMGATAEPEKLAIAKKAEAEGFGHLIRRHDPSIDPSEIDQIVTKYASARDKMRVTLKNRAYSAARDHNNQRIDFVDNGNTPTVIHPVLASNLAEKIPLADMEVINKALARRGSGVLRTAAKVTDPAFDLADIMMSAWKVTSLMRFGYMVRVLADDELAYVANLGAMTALGNLPEATANYIANKAIRTGLRLRRGKFHAQNAGKFAVEPFQKLADKIMYPGSPIDQALRASNRTPPSQAFLEAPEDLKPGRKKYLGQKSEDVTLSNGQTVTLQGFAPPTQAGDYWRKLTSDDRLALDDVSDSYLANMRKEMAHGLVDQSDLDGFFRSWAKALNHQLGSDEMGKLLLGGRNWPFVSNWLRTDEAGRAYAKRLPLRALDPDTWAANIEHYVEQYAPTPELRAAALLGKVTEGMLKKIPLQLRPEQVHGAMLDYNMGKGGIAGQMLKFREGFFRRFNQIPTDTLVRHPLAKALYETRRNELVNGFVKTGGTLDNPVLRKLENQARSYTVKEINNIVLDLSTHSNAAHVLRFIAPFYNAWDKALKRWGRMAYGDPGIIFKGNRIWQGINNMPIMMDALTGRQGGDVENSKGVSLYNPKRGVKGYTGIANAADQFLTFRMPEALAKRMGATVMDQVAIPKSSLNLVLQGDPWYLPGFGPFVQLPASQLVKSQPKYADMMKTILPYGPQDWKNTFIPTSARKFGDWQADESQQYQATMVNIWRTRYTKWLEGGRAGPEPRLDDPTIAKDAGRLHALRFISQMVMPVNVQFQTPYKFYIDQYHKMMEDPNIGPQNARDAFIQQYPDYFMFADSISKNNSGLPATVEAYAASKKYSKLMAKTPDIAGAVIGNAAQGGDFSQTVYKLQFSQRLNPASSKTGRQGQDLQSFGESALADQGWVQYKKISDQIRVELSNRGLESVSQKGAEDLKKIKAAVVDKLSQLYPQWYTDYTSYDSAKQTAVVDQLYYLAQAPQMKDRTDIAQLRNYLALRDTVLAELAARKRSGGSGNLAANTNNDLQQLWTEQRDALSMQHTVFSDVIYDRYLVHDDQLMAR